MTNNDILKKLRVALKLQDDDIIKILKFVKKIIQITKNVATKFYEIF